MYIPSTYTAQLAFMIGSMVCWGSWANSVKLAPGWRFQSFYWDYVLGVLLGSFVFGAALGGPAFLAGLFHASGTSVLLGILAGVVFNVANQLLVAAIDVAGLAVAFPIGIGLALVVGVLLNYLLAPAADPFLLFGGVALVVIAIVIDAYAYRRRERERTTVSRQGIVLSLVSGLLMGGFYPILTRSMQGERPLGAYSAVPCFAVGLALCALPLNLWMMRRPFTGEPVRLANYTAAPPVWHLWGLVGGLIWGHRPATEPRGLARPDGRSRGLLRSRARSHHDLGGLGRLPVARVPRRPTRHRTLARYHVCLLPCGSSPDRLRPLASLALPDDAATGVTLAPRLVSKP